MVQVRTALFMIPVLLTARTHAAFGFQLDGTLDKEAISHAYFEGEFHRVLPPLEMYRQGFPATATREDSIFVFKYLSVIYAADSSSRTKGESYMVQLLKLMPTIELLDLYISDNIQAIFKDVKQKYLHEQNYIRNHDQYGRPIADSSSKNPKKSSKGFPRWAWWTLGGVGTAAIAAGTFYVVNDSEPKKERVVIPPGDE